MRGIRLGNFDGVLIRRIVLLALAFATAIGGSSLRVGATNTLFGDDDPVYTSYRGIHIGSTTAETRKALGDPIDKSDTQDLFVFNEKEIATVVYDKEHKVVTISVDFMGDESHPPTAVQVVGAAPTAKPDGSASMTVRYPKAGYSVCYAKTGSTPTATVSVTMQKMQ